jgi:hypothetical protein
MLTSAVVLLFLIGEFHQIRGEKAKMATAARSQIHVPRLGSEDPFRPEMRARLQNIRSDMIRGTPEVWRGQGAWNTSAGHQRVTVKIRYRSDAAGAEAYVKYMTKDGKGLDGAKPEAFNATEREFDAPARVRGWMKEGDERWFKLVYSPEKPFHDLEGMVKHSMARAEEHLGTKLEWLAVRHHDGGKDHVHVFLRGRDDQNNTLAIDKKYIQFGFRDSAQRYVTYQPRFGLGERSVQEIEAGKARSLEIRETRSEVRSLVAEARGEGLLDRHDERRISQRIRNASPAHLDEIRREMRDRLDAVENIWREKSIGGGVARDALVSRETVARTVDRDAESERAKRRGGLSL